MLRDPIKKALLLTISDWDHDGVRVDVRRNFLRVLDCRTPGLGSTVYASATESKVVPHTCKSKMCPSCGHRATALWQREQWASLPDIPYVGLTLTMPKDLWGIFQRNSHLLQDLPSLGAEVVKQWANVTHGATVFTMVVRHTFSRNLGFNPHLHMLLSAGGLRQSDGRWIRNLQIRRSEVMWRWRYAIITYLRTAFRSRLINNASENNIEEVLQTWERRWWSTHVDSFASKYHFLRYAGRYVRRPPVAQYRFLSVDMEEVTFWTNDLKSRSRVVTRYATGDFIKALAEQVPDRYQNAVHYYGLLAPRGKSSALSALLAIFGQRKRAKPQRLSWAMSIERSFGINPLIDSNGERMRPVAILAAPAPRVIDPSHSLG
jgi:hypothetical protein